MSQNLLTRRGESRKGLKKAVTTGESVIGHMGTVARVHSTAEFWKRSAL